LERKTALKSVVAEIGKDGKKMSGKGKGLVDMDETKSRNGN
jgi:hypothetical protein